MAIVEIALDFQTSQQSLQTIERSLISNTARKNIQFGRHELEAQGYSCAETNFPELELED